MHNYLILDFDSTIVSIEGLDELAKIVLAGARDGAQIIQAVEQLTHATLNGAMTFDESLSRRLQLFQANQGHINKLVELMKRSITPSVARNEAYLRAHSEHIYIMSGGFREYVVPIAEQVGLRGDHVMANSFLWDKAGRVCGCDTRNLMAQHDGKVKQLKELNLPGHITIVGDGYTDWRPRDEGIADAFIALIENIDRPEVSARADYVATTFDDVIAYTQGAHMAKS